LTPGTTDTNLAVRYPDRRREVINMQFKLSKAINGQTYFEIQATGNYETLTTSETYRNKSDAIEAIGLIQKDAASAPIIDNT
jgi:uncharacterized protein YegP (UPF0339 family)